MKVIEAGRLVFPSDAKAAREFAERNLVSIHSRADRFAAVTGRVNLRGESREVAASSPLSFIAGAGNVSEVERMLRIETLEGSDWVLLRDYGETNRDRSILFTFSEGDLSRVVKLRSIQSGGAALRNEAAVLDHLRSLPDEAVSVNVPRVLELGETGDYEVLVLSPVVGQPLWISMQRSLRPLGSHAQPLARAGAWLGRFHREIAHAGASGGPASTDPEEESAVGATAGPSVIVHGDLWSRNILFDRDQRLSGVVDWERASLHGPRWHDLFSLPLLFVMDRPSWVSGNPLERFERGFLSDSRTAAVVTGYLDAYVTEAGIDRRTLRPMFEAFLDGAEAQAGKEDRGWRRELPWPAMRARLRIAARTVFSG